MQGMVKAVEVNGIIQEEHKDDEERKDQNLNR